jgi:large subunit ribosomal protein L25
MKFVAFSREVQGTGASRRLRIAGKVPGIVYGAGEPAQIELDHNALYFALKKEAFHASILEMELNGQVDQVLLRDVQYHPYKQLVLHVDFQRVSATQKLHIKVPLHFTNEDAGPGVKLGGGLVNHVTTEVEVACLAKDLPEFIEVDLGALKLGENIHASQLKLPKGVSLVKHGEDDPVVVSIVGKGGAKEEVAAAE